MPWSAAGNDGRPYVAAPAELAMAFHGWPGDAIEFFRGLEANNTKDYWQRHLDVYERVVRRPMAELLTELEPDFGPGRVLRPYRDVRFSLAPVPARPVARNEQGKGASYSRPT